MVPPEVRPIAAPVTVEGTPDVALVERRASLLRSIARERADASLGPRGRWSGLVLLGLLAAVLFTLAALIPTPSNNRSVKPSASPIVLSLPAPPSPVQAAMGRIQFEDALIIKGMRTKEAFSKNRAAIATAAGRISKIASSIRNDPTHAKALDLPQALWVADMDTLILASDDFAGLVDQPSTNQMEAKESFRRVVSACASCHGTFRKD